MSRSFQYSPFYTGHASDRVGKRNIHKSFRRLTKVKLIDINDETIFPVYSKYRKDLLYKYKGFYLEKNRNDYDICMRK